MSGNGGLKSSIKSLLFMRFLLILSPGYIHPDEFFQSSEVISHRILHSDGILPWEFQNNNKLSRSVAPLVFTHGLPYLALRYIFLEKHHVKYLSGILLWILPKLVLFWFFYCK